jgi:hypothetical protein
MTSINYEPWPELPYEKFASTGHLLHMATQAIGKLKLLTPFEPQWANVPLWVTSRGLTTGPIPYQPSVFSIDMDLIDHQVICTTGWGSVGEFKLDSMSVANFVKKLLAMLRDCNIEITINPKPQETPNPILFDQDTEQRLYNNELANAWWRILVSTNCVMERHRSRFRGKTPQIGLMWGTFDLRNARYNGTPVPTTGVNSGYLRRNAMDEAQVEAGWWSGNPTYKKAAYFSFTYPQPKGIEEAKIKPAAARWEKAMGSFILDYDDVRKSKNPKDDLLAFFESTYQVGAELAGWDPKLIGSGEPI